MRGLTREGIVEPLDISRDEILRREWGHGKCVQLTIMKEDCQPLRVVPILHHGLNGQNSENYSMDGDIKALMDGSGESTENIVRPGECTSEGLEDSSDLEEDMPFEPYDVNCDGRIIKMASQYSKDAWKRPEPEWEVAVTVHGFCEIATISTEDDTSKDEDMSSSKETRMNKVEPNLQLEFKLGKDEHEGFPQGVIDQAKSAGVELNPLLHSAIASMVRNERATFSVSRISADKAKVNDGSKSTITTFRLEYDISLDAWTEEIDLSGRDDGSLVKRVMRDGDGVVEPTEVGKVTVRCRITRKCFQSQDLGEETVVFDNLQSQDGSSEGDDALKGPFTFALDDCPFGSGFTAIIKSMRTGELCQARLEPEYAPVEYLGDESFQHHAVVELLEVEDLPPLWSTDDVRLEMAKRFKLEGNEKFSAGDFIRALRRYERAIQYVDGVPPGDYSDEDDGFDDSPSIENERGCREEEVGTDEWSPLGSREAELVDLQVAILCNQAACHLKLGDGAAALEVADRASTFKAPVDGAAGVKAAYRRACALEAVGDLDEARVAFKSVLDVDPKNSQSIQGLARIARAEKVYQARLRKAFGGCLTSGKLRGFASEGRETSSKTRQGEEEDGEDSFDARQRHLADGSWSDESGGSSETEENDDSYDEDLPLLAKGNKESADVDQSPSVIEDSVLKAAEQVQVSETACTGSGGSLSLSLNPAGGSSAGEREMDEKLLDRSCSRSPQTGEVSNSNGNIGAKLGTEVLPPPPPQA